MFEFAKKRNKLLENQSVCEAIKNIETAFKIANKFKYAEPRYIRILEMSKRTYEIAIVFYEKVDFTSMLNCSFPMWKQVNDPTLGETEIVLFSNKDVENWRVFEETVYKKIENEHPEWKILEVYGQKRIGI